MINVSLLNLDRWENINPQLLRELKSRLNWRNSLITIALSALGQLLIVMNFYARLPKSPQPSQIYCRIIPEYKCATDGLGNVLINWPKWWADISVALSWVMAFILAIGGVYLLASNFSQEERRGTLDFIRLTPQKACTIILGKFAGVPILIYLGVVSALPLQLHAVHEAGISRLHVLSWDVLTIMVSLLLYAGAVLAALWFRAAAILLASAMAFFMHQVISLSMRWYRHNNINSMEWYSLSIDNNLPYYLAFSILAGIGIYWLYQAIERRYLKPKSTVLSKPQSYLWSLTYHLFLLGFCVTPGEDAWPSFHAPFQFGNASSIAELILAIFGTAWLLLLIPLLLPSQRSLAEWSRYHHLHRSSSWLKSLLWDDGSPAVLAVVINVLIGFGVWTTPLLLSGLATGKINYWPWLLMAMVITVLLMAIYSTIAHWVIFWQVNHRHYWSTGIISGLICLPLVGASITSPDISTAENPLFLASPFLWTSLKGVSPLAFLVVIPLLMGMLGYLSFRFRRTLVKVGRSESYQAMNNLAPLPR